MIYSFSFAKPCFCSFSKDKLLIYRNINWSGKRDSNSRPRPWQGRALPTELFPLFGATFGESIVVKAIRPKVTAEAIRRSQYSNALTLRVKHFVDAICSIDSLAVRKTLSNCPLERVLPSSSSGMQNKDSIVLLDVSFPALKGADNPEMIH